MHESIDGYRVFFHGIVGFFVCEDHILNTGNGLITRGHLDEVWSNASGRIFSTLQTHSAYCTDAGFMLKIKNLMLLFSNTLQGYGFAVEKLYALLHVRNIFSFYIPIISSIYINRSSILLSAKNLLYTVIFLQIKVSTNILQYGVITLIIGQYLLVF